MPEPNVVIEATLTISNCCMFKSCVAIWLPRWSPVPVRFVSPEPSPQNFIAWAPSPATQNRLVAPVDTAITVPASPAPEDTCSRYKGVLLSAITIPIPTFREGEIMRSWFTESCDIPKPGPYGALL